MQFEVLRRKLTAVLIRNMDKINGYNKYINSDYEALRSEEGQGGGM